MSAPNSCVQLTRRNLISAIKKVWMGATAHHVRAVPAGVVNLLLRHACVRPVPQVVTDQVDGPRHRPPRRDGCCVGCPRWVASALVAAGLQPLQQQRLVLCIRRAAGTGWNLFLLVLAAF